MSVAPRIAVVLVAVCFASRPAVAQTAISLAAGASVPTGDFSSFHDTGYRVLAGLGVQPILLPVGFRVDGSFDSYTRNGGLTGSDRILSLMGNVTAGAGGVLGPYAIGGIGFSNFQGSGGAGTANKFAYNVGAGFRFGLTGFSVFAEAKYHRADTIGVFPITFGVTF